MPYPVDPNDWLTPADGQDAEQGAEEFRKLKASLNEERAAGSSLGAAANTWINMYEWETPMNVTELVEYWIAATNDPAQWGIYGEHGIIYKSAAGVANLTRLMVGTLSNSRLNGNYLQYLHTPGGGAPLDIYYRIYGRKIRTPYP